MLTLHIETYQEGHNLGRLEGFQLIVAALGGSLERVEMKPLGESQWQLDISLALPREKRQRCEQVAAHMFDGPVTITETGTKEEPL